MKKNTKVERGYTSNNLRLIAEKRLKALFPNGRPRFGDARDNGCPSVCTSKGFSTMPSRKAA